MMRTKHLIMSFVAIATLGVGASARAQDSSTPPPAESTPPPATHSSGGGGGNSISLSGGAGLGIGATIPLASSIAGFFPAANVVYDTAEFHVEGILGIRSQPNPGTDRSTSWVFGAGGWYHLHRGSSSDFSLGAALAINYVSAPGGSATLTSIEPGAMVRAFLTPNVALFARGGLAILLGDSAPGGGANFYLGSQPTIVAGFTYFFR
jgi:hypothetical protein